MIEKNIWNDGILGRGKAAKLFHFSQPIIPIFQLVFQVGQSPEFLCYHQVTKIFPIKLREL